MATLRARTQRERVISRAAAVLGLALFASYAYFYQAGGWNQNSRFDVIRAILERHTLQIDAYASHTGDRAQWRGHSYSDKAPGNAMLGLIPVAAARGLGRLAGVDPTSAEGIVWSSYIASIVTAGAFTVMAALVVFWLTVTWTGELGPALFAATAYGLATPAWAYATVFVGHGVTAGCLMLAFAAAVHLNAAPNSSAPGREGWRLWQVGWWIGLAVLSEFPAAVPSAVIGVWALTASRAQKNRHVIASALLIGAGGVIPALVLFAHNAIAFGSPLHLGYGVADSPLGGINTGFFGITHPTWSTLYEVLLGSYRGLLPVAPLVAVAPIGLWLLARRPVTRAPALVAAAIATYYVLLNASYHFWEGGWFYGPRHLTPGLPFLSLGLAPLWQWCQTRMRRLGGILLAAGWLWGAGVTLVTVSTTVQLPSDIQAPLREWSWPAFREGDLSLNSESYFSGGVDRSRLRHHPEDHAAFNLGELLGLRGLPSLLPLAAVWLFAAWLFTRLRQLARTAH